MGRVIKTPLVVGLSGAIVASLCCATPVLLVVFGLATSSLVVAWLNVKPVFYLLAAMLLIGGLTYSLLRSKGACAVSSYRRRLWLFPLVTVVSFAAGYWLLMGVATPRIYSQIYTADSAAVQRGGMVMGAGGQAVMLRRATFTIYMGCEGCASTLRTVFLKLPGVHAAAIDTQHRAASVLYDPTRIDAATLKAKIPYPWYYTPHLRSDVQTAVVAIPATSTFQVGSTLLLLGGLLVALGATSAVVWSTRRLQSV